MCMHSGWRPLINMQCRFISMAHELRAWLLHYSSVVLKGILHEDYYQLLGSVELGALCSFFEFLFRSS